MLGEMLSSSWLSVPPDTLVLSDKKSPLRPFSMAARLAAFSSWGVLMLLVSCRAQEVKADVIRDPL